ncbi:hypothetical protein ACA910_010923 [Epithemia clementina (nom. ined.)]
MGASSLAVGRQLLMTTLCISPMNILLFPGRNCMADFSFISKRTHQVNLVKRKPSTVFWRHQEGSGLFFSSFSSSSSSAPPRRIGGDQPIFAKRKAGITEEDEALKWESFEFGYSPKWDKRFDDPSAQASSSSSSETLQDLLTAAKTEEALETVRQAEAQRDAASAEQRNAVAAAWEQLDPLTVQRATDLLRPFVREERVQRIESVLQQRTSHVRFLFENPSNPSNVWACLRTLDSFGIQYVDVIVDPSQYKGKAALYQKRSMRTAMGSAQWLTIRDHRGSTPDAMRIIKKQGALDSAVDSMGNNDTGPTLDQKHSGCIVLASDLNPDSIDIRQIDWASFGDTSLCIVMGNEETGISDEMRSLADVTFTLPMSGFAESFNLSVATAITLAYLSAASSSSSMIRNEEKTEKNKGKGPLRPGDLSAHQFNCLRLKGFINSVAQKRMALALLKREGITLPQL